MRLRIRAIGALLKKFEMNESDTFRLFIKPFMDAGRGTRTASTAVART